MTAANLKERSETLLEQYGKTGSLFPHNVVLVPLGDDFTYDHENEWDQQYSNYKMIMDYINQVRTQKERFKLQSLQSGASTCEGGFEGKFSANSRCYLGLYGKYSPRGPVELSENSFSKPCLSTLHVYKLFSN